MRRYKVGGKYFLSQVRVEGSANGSELAKPRMEERLSDDGSKSEKHSIAAFLKPLNS
jgi:hypothetical protein